MRFFSIFIPALLVFPGIALGGQVYGKLKEGGRAVPQESDVTVRCAQGKRYSTKTDRFGSYRVYVREKGRCTLRVKIDGISGEYPIRSFDDPVRYDFELVKTDNGYVLKRK